jgi:transposase, IS5 family
MARATTRQMTFADLELALQGVQLDPTLQAICDLLDENREVLERVQCDLHRGLKNPSKGRHGLTARQVVGALVLMRMKNWDYRELRERIADGVTLRQFTDFHCDKVPKHDAFNRGINRLTPETLKDINDIFVGVAVELGLEDGSKLRVDTTVVETDILSAAADKMSNADNIVMRSWTAEVAYLPNEWPFSAPHNIGGLPISPQPSDELIRRLELAP